jgi:hypothetical protein
MRAIVAALALVVAAGAAIAIWYFVARDDRPVRPGRPPLVAKVDAFERGGTPVRDPAIEQLMLELERVAVIQQDVYGAPPAIVARGAALADAWRVVIDSFATWRLSPDPGGEVEQELRADVLALNGELANAGVGFQLELRFRGKAEERDVGVIIHRVDEVGFVVANGVRRRVLGLRRADGVVLSRGALGFETPELGPVLMLDPITSYVVTDVIPVLAPDAPFKLGLGGFREREGKELAALAGAAVRRELVAALGAADSAKATRIATLIAERNRLVDAWREVRFGTQHGLFISDDIMAKTTRSKSRERVDEIEDELVRQDADRIAIALEAIVAASVRRHEAQHAVDLARAEPLRYPYPLELVAGAQFNSDGKPRITVTFARAELVAYLSQLVNDPITPHLTLWGVVTFTFGAKRTSVEANVGKVLVHGLAKHLGTETADSVAAATACANASGDQLRAAARALWTELYTEQPPTIVDP